MDTRERILTKTIMEIVDKSKIIRNGIQSLEWPYVTVLPGKDQESYYRYTVHSVNAKDYTKEQLDVWATNFQLVELALPENLSGRAVFHPAASSIFSIKIPYPEVGSFTKTWVTAPMSLPSCKMGLPLIPCTIPPV